jgi:steroid 5-alpha reductase family enzyme
MGFWWGLLLFGVSAAPTWWWTAVGAVSITLMFRFVSLPLIEDRMLETHPDYAAYAARTPRVVPGRIGR